MPAKRVCVIIPTYNNEKTLLHVIDSVLEYSHHVIVVNDGSTDSTAALLQQRAEQICIYWCPVNLFHKGKKKRGGSRTEIRP